MRNSLIAPIVVALVGCAATTPGAPPSGLPDGVSEISGTDPTGSDTDLAPLYARLGTARYIGIGESVHTSGGYYAMKRRLIEDMIANHGIRVLAMETPRTRAASVEAYIQSTGGDAKTALEGIFPVFCDDNTEALVEWIQAYNLQHSDDRVHFFGFDEQQPAEDYAQLQAFINAAAGSAGTGLLAGLATCQLDEYDLPTAASPYTAAQYDQCTQGLDALDAYITANRAELQVATGEETEELAEIASISLRSWQPEIYYETSDVPQSYEVRDIAMHTIFARLRDMYYPGVPTVIWMHDYHLEADHPDVTGDSLDGVQTFGTQLQAEIGSDYAPIALIGYNVSINWPGVGAGPTQTPAADSLEAQLHALGHPYLFADPTSAFVGSAVTTIIYSQMIASQQFRAFVYLDVSPGMNALFW